MFYGIIELTTCFLERLDMKFNELLNLLNDNLEEGHKMSEEQLKTILLDTSRIADKYITEDINEIKKNYSIKINSTQKELLRKAILGYNIDDKIIEDIVGTENIDSLSFMDLKDSSHLLESALHSVNEGFQRNSEKMLHSLSARFYTMYLNRANDLNNYIRYLQHLQHNQSQLSIVEIDGDSQLSANNIAEIIKNEYDNLSNFHYMIILFKDTSKHKIKWSTVSEVAIFMEHFKKEHQFSVFEKSNKKHRIDEMIKFIDENNHIDLDNDLISAINAFYDGVDYGFHFEDLLLSSDGSQKALIMQKVELDENPKKCPVCHEEIVRGNSYPRLLYKSFECQNPYCSSRSKIGRGKRYDLFSAKRQIMLERNSYYDQISDDIYKNYRRDILNSKKIEIQDLIQLYSWDSDTVKLINSTYNKKNCLGRSVQKIVYHDFSNNDYVNSLELTALFDKIVNKIYFKENYKVLNKNKIKDSIILNGNSSDLIPFISEITSANTITGAITSPPYYNAREYSQWPNLLLYLIDMMINAKAIFEVLEDNATYIYNIGDIVGQDNIYIKSNMSKRRQMLGFYSVFIFSIIGFNLTGNIIWDKGEVQSKRNSTSNHVSGYLKPVNAYEHCWIFQKQPNSYKSQTTIVKIDPVKKINSKGDNIFGHTAPYPIELVKIIYPFIKNKNGYILDPFLGSGTTIISMMENGYKAIGFELNEDYYNLAVQKIEESTNTLFNLN